MNSLSFISTLQAVWYPIYEHKNYINIHKSNLDNRNIAIYKNCMFYSFDEKSQINLQKHLRDFNDFYYDDFPYNLSTIINKFKTKTSDFDIYFYKPNIIHLQNNKTRYCIMFTPLSDNSTRVFLFTITSDNLLSSTNQKDKYKTNSINNILKNII